MGKTSSSVKFRYNTKAYDRIGVSIPKGRLIQVQKHFEEEGISINLFINNVLRDTLGMTEEEWRAKTEISDEE